MAIAPTLGQNGNSAGWNVTFDPVSGNLMAGGRVVSLSESELAALRAWVTSTAGLDPVGFDTAPGAIKSEGVSVTLDQVENAAVRALLADAITRTEADAAYADKDTEDLAALAESTAVQAKTAVEALAAKAVTAEVHPVTGGIKKLLAAMRDVFADRAALSEEFTAIGDSISSGCTDTEKLGWLAYLKCLAGPALTIHRATAANWAYAHPGYTTAQMLADGFHTQAAASSAQTVFVFAGANDFPTAATYLTTYNNILALAAPAIAAGKRVVIMSMLPRTHASTAENMLYMGKIASMLSDWCRANTIKFVDIFTQSTDRTTGGLRADVTADLVHPSEAWHWWIASKAFAALGFTAPAQFVARQSGTLNANPFLQTFTNGLAAGWQANACTPAKHTNSGSVFVGDSQKITPTGDWAYLYRTEGGVVSGATVRVAAIFEVLSTEIVTGLYLSATIYKNGGGTQAHQIGSSNSSQAQGTPRAGLAPGVYTLVFDMVAEDGGNILINAGGQGTGAIVIHYASSYIVS